jgi:hypothetical protein
MSWNIVQCDQRDKLLLFMLQAETGEINRLKDIPVNTKAADDKFAAFIYARISD